MTETEKALLQVFQEMEPHHLDRILAILTPLRTPTISDDDMRIVTGRDGAQFAIRMPEELREEIKETAARNGRSMNAEIVFRLIRGRAL